MIIFLIRYDELFPEVSIVKNKASFALILLLLISLTSFANQGTSQFDAHAQQLCADAVFTKPLPQSFTTGTSIPFTVNFGGTFSSINAITAYSFFDSTDTFDAADSYFIDNFGGQGPPGGSDSQTEKMLNAVDPTVTNQFLGGTFSGSYISEQGSFTLNKLTFCIQQPATFDVPPTPADEATFNIHTGDTLSFKVECSDPNPPDTVFLQASSTLSEGAIFPVETFPIGIITGNPVSGTFSWTPTTAQTVKVTFSCQEQLTTTFHSVNIVVSSTNPQLFCGKPASAYAHVIQGTSGNDALIGTDDSDLILGFAGNDFIVGKGGDDCLIGGDGNDTILAGDGNDIMLGGPGDDFLVGNHGNDTILGGDGNDIISGGDGNDILNGESGNDKIFGGSGNDTIAGEGGNDGIDGGPDTDTCNGGSGVNQVINCEIK